MSLLALPLFSKRRASGEAEGEKKMKLKGKVAIVTGGARGIGKSCALRLIEEGAKVVIVDVIDMKEVGKAIEERGGEALTLWCNVSEEENTEEMANKTIERFGRIDILVNNAANFAHLGKKPFYEISGHEWDQVMKVNLKGTFFCCKAVYPQMKKQGKGKIINMSSAAFFRGFPNFLHYVCSKGALIGLTRGLARELGDNGICVNAVAPGYTLSDAIIENPLETEESRDAIRDSRCIKRDEVPEDITGAVVFLASTDCDFVTGQTIVIDGGSSFI